MNFGIPPGDLFQIYELKESYAAIALVTFGDDPRKAGRCTWLISFTKSQNQKEKRRYKISLI